MNFVCAYGYGVLQAYACVRTKLEVLVGLLSTLCFEAQSLTNP